MTDTPETDRLIERLTGDPSRVTLGFHVTWGPKAHLLTPEERAAHINRALDDVGERIENIDEWEPKP